MIDVEDQLRRSLHAVADATPVGPAPDLSPPQQRATHTPSPSRPPVCRRKIAAALAAAVLVPVAGISAAAAGGVLPQPFVDAMGFLRQEGVSPETAKLVGSLAGPTGKRFEVWRTRSQSTTCLSIWFMPSTAPAGQAVPEVGGGGATTCRSAPATVFAQGGTLDGGNAGPWVFKYDAGPATRATLQLRDGTTMPTLVSDGLILGWLPSFPSDGPPAVLTGFTDTGAIVGRTTVDLRTGTTPR